jgi:type II secretory pathway component PulJ
MNAMFIFSNAIPRMIARMPRSDGRHPRNLDLFLVGAFAFADHACVDVVRDRRSAGQGQARDDGQDGGESDRRQEAEQHVAADRMRQVHGDHVAATDQRALDVTALEVLGVLTDQQDGNQAHAGR